MTIAPQLTATASDDVLELRPAGSWTAANVTAREMLSGAVAAQLASVVEAALGQMGPQARR